MEKVDIEIAVALEVEERPPGAHDLGGAVRALGAGVVVEAESHAFGYLGEVRFVLGSHRERLHGAGTKQEREPNFHRSLLVAGTCVAL